LAALGTDITPLTHSKLLQRTWSKPSKTKSVTSEEQPPCSSCCYNCGGRGHLACNCPSPKQEGDKANSITKGNDASSLYSDTSYQYQYPYIPLAFIFTCLLVFDSEVVMCQAWLGLKAQAWARLQQAQAYQNPSLTLSLQSGLSPGFECKIP